MSFTYYPKYKLWASEATISWDVSGYYWYLPSLFVYKDLKNLNFSDSVRNQFGPSPDNQQITILPDGKKVLKYSSGMALQYMPFFLIAHNLAKPLGFEANGFSKPYQLSVHIGALIMMLFGLWFLRKILLEYFKDSTVAWVMFFLILGTNYLNYVSIDVGMSHAWLFSWYCMLMFLSNQFYKQPSLKLSIGIGLTIGILTLTRPTEIISIILPICWGLHSISWNLIKERFVFIFKHFKLYVVAILAMICVGCIQLMYWKYATGHWFVYSYGDQHFTWKHPHFYDYIFSYRCGWLLYTPLMIFPYVGFIFLFKRKIQWLPIAIFSFIYLWIVCAWDIWWYGGRAMIQGYAVLMFPLAALVEFVNRKKLAILLFYPIAFVCIYLNIWWVHGCHLGGYIYATDMSEAYYKKIVGQFNIDERDRRFLDLEEDYLGDTRDCQLLYTHNFAQTNQDSNQVQQGLFIHEKQKLEYKIPIDLLFLQPKKWIRISSEIRCLKNNWDSGRMTVMGIRLFEKGILVKENRLLLDRLFYKTPEQEIYIDLQVPTSPFDQAEIYFYQPEEGGGEFSINSLQLKSFTH